MENSVFCPPASDSEEIDNLIHRQKNKSTDLLNIPVLIYKILTPPTSPTVSMLLEGIFSECFKAAKVIPIFKSGNLNSITNLCARLDSYIISNNI